MDLTDALGRKLRWRSRTQRGKRCEIGARQLAVFSFLERHGYLPSHYLHEKVGGEKNTFQKNLAKLYDWGYLERFDEQRTSIFNRLRHIVYGLTDKSRQCLADAGLLHSCYDRTDQFEHRLMSGCVGSSIELGCGSLRYIPRHEVLSKKGNPLRIPLPHFSERSYLEPDDLFAIQYQDGSYRRYAVEIDRGTEPVEGTNRNSSIEKKLNYYHDVISNRRYRDYWDIPGMMVLIATTRPGRIKNIITLLKSYDDPKFAERFLFKSYPIFGTNNENWLVPPTILTDILDPWESVNGTFDITKP